MKQRALVAIFVAIFAFLGWYVVISFSHRSSFEKDFALEDLNGHTLRLSRFAGQPIILYFFSPRCGDCKEEAPLLNELYASYRKKGLVIIGIGVKYPEEIREFVKTHGVEYPVVMDLDLAVCKDFGVFFLPHLVFINRQGKVVAAETGKMSLEQLKERTESIL